MSTDHISNREELINFIKADTVGPIKDTTKYKFKELDTSRKIVLATEMKLKIYFAIKKQEKRFFIWQTGSSTLYRHIQGFFIHQNR